MHKNLLARGIRVGKERGWHLMQQHGFKAKTKRKFVVTSDSRHNLPVAPDQVQRRFNPEAPKRLRSGDITCIATDEGLLSLAAVIDRFSRGWWAGACPTAARLSITYIAHGSTSQMDGNGSNIHARLLASVEDWIPAPLKAEVPLWRKRSGGSNSPSVPTRFCLAALLQGSASQLTCRIMSNRLFSFTGSSAGRWRVHSQRSHIGPALPPASFVNVVNGQAPAPTGGWVLRGVTSNDRYVERAEKQELLSKQQGLGRVEATYAALIPIRKTPSWWALTQDERRAIFEEQSQHIRIGMKYLPPIARRLHHCRDLEEPEAFDFLTWFEFDPAQESAFDELLAELRESEEWKYVEHEIDIRLINGEA
jgi:hypothetical protein